jgi:hypothetical protein
MEQNLPSINRTVFFDKSSQHFEINLGIWNYDFALKNSLSTDYEYLNFVSI